MTLLKNKALEVFERDIDSIILGFDSFLRVSIDEMRPLDFHVIASGRGITRVYIDIPDAFLSFQLTQIEASYNFWRAIKFKQKFAKAEKKAVDPIEIEKRERRKADYRNELFTVFDGLMNKGVPVRDAVSQTSRTLKSKGFANSDYHLVVSALSSSGRLRGTGFHGKTK